MKAALLYLFAASAWAQTSQPLQSVMAPAGSGIPWWAWPVAAAVIVVAGFVWLKFKSPATATQVQGVVGADVSAVGSGLHRLAAALEEKVRLAPALADHAAASAEPAPAPEPPPAGKQGVPGIFSLQVTGDAKSDLAAIQAQYFG